MLRLPLQTIFTHTAGSTSSSIVANLPTNDFTGLVAKLTAASFFGTAASETAGGLDLYIQTTDDGGTTFYDVGRFAHLKATTTARDAKWLTIPVAIGDGLGFASATDMSLAVNTIGLPILSRTLKLKWTITGAGSTTTANWTCVIYANSTERT